MSDGYVTEGGYTRLRISERVWPVALRANVAGVPIVTFGLVTEPLGRIDVIDAAVMWYVPELIEPHPDAWARIQELGERSAAGRLQPAEACEGSNTLAAGAPDSGVPLTQD